MNLRLLLVEDSATVRKLVEICARKRGFTLEAVASGAAGVESALSRPPDLILLDFMLPDMEGVQVCEALAANPRTAGVPVLIASAKGPTVLRRFDRFANVHGLLPKPFSEAELLESMRRLVPAAFGAAVLTPSSVLPAARPPSSAPPRPPSSQPVPVRKPQALREAPHPLAGILAEVLDEGFARIPSLEPRRSGAPASGFYAEQLLTPAVISALLQRLPSLGAGARESGSPPSRGPEAHAVLDRSSRFDERVRTHPLPARERRVLALIDGRRTTEELARLSALPMPDLQLVLRGLLAGGFLVRVGDSSGPVSRPAPSTRRVAIVVDADVRGFVQPLARLCGALETPVALVISTREEAGAALKAHAPDVVLLSGSSVDEMVGMGRVFASLLAPTARLVAVLSPSQHAVDPRRLLGAGYTSVLQKPIAEEQLRRLFVDSPSRAAG